MLKTKEFKDLEDRFCLTLDSLNAIDLANITSTFAGRLKRVKLGLAFGRESQTHYRQLLQKSDIRVMYDGMFINRARQMGSVVMAYEDDGYNCLTVSIGAEDDAIVVAANSASKAKIAVAIPPNQPHLLSGHLYKLASVNDRLSENNKIVDVLVDVADIEKVRSTSDYIITATGIYIPRYEPDDASARMTAVDARSAGADIIAVGTAITCSASSEEMYRRFNLVLDDIASVQ